MLFNRKRGDEPLTPGLPKLHNRFDFQWFLLLVLRFLFNQFYGIFLRAEILTPGKGHKILSHNCNKFTCDCHFQRWWQSLSTSRRIILIQNLLRPSTRHKQTVSGNSGSWFTVADLSPIYHLWNVLQLLMSSVLPRVHRRSGLTHT